MGGEYTEDRMEFTTAKFKEALKISCLKLEVEPIQIERNAAGGVLRSQLSLGASNVGGILSNNRQLWCPGLSNCS